MPMWLNSVRTTELVAGRAADYKSAGVYYADVAQFSKNNGVGRRQSG